MLTFVIWRQRAGQVGQGRGQLQLIMRGSEGPKRGSRAAALARNLPEVQLPKGSMEIQSLPVSGGQETNRAVHEWQVLSHRLHFPGMES